MQKSVRSLILYAAGLALASLAALLHPHSVLAAGVVTDCTTFGPGPGTLAEAIATDGLVTFTCSGTIVLPAEIAMGDDRHLLIDGSGQSITFSGADRTRHFNLGSGSSLHLHKVTLSAGRADGGGAIQSAGILTITNSALLSNTADYGGALELINGSAWIQDSTLAGNTALDPNQGGGAINQYFDPHSGGNYDQVPNVVIVNSTIAENIAAAGRPAGIWQETGKLRIVHSIVADNPDRNCLVLGDKPQQFSSINSLDDDGSCLAALQADPQLAPLGASASAPPFFPLLPGSPAIDAAPLGACAGKVDQRSVLRPRDGNYDGATTCDLGAYEFAGRFLVSAAAADGLEGYWKFDEGSGAAVMDSSGRGLVGAVFGGSTFTTGHPNLLFNAPFALQTALSGEGSPAAGLQVADASPLNPAGELTVAAWVRLNSSSGVQPIVAKLDEGQGRGYGLFLRGGALSAEAADSAGVRHVITGEVVAGSWLHVAMTYQQGGDMTAYVNGRKVGGQAVTEPLAAASVPLIMAVDGAIDDVRVYSRAISAGAVAALAAGRSCVTTGTTWADAVPDLQCALADAATGAEVWLAPGIYRPTFGPDRTATFAIGDGVAVYGGFAGSESQRDQRLPQTPRPVLSGDILADDPVDAAGVLVDPAAAVGGNSYHVVSISSTLTSTVLDQVTITGGQAGGAPGATCGPACGGGIYLAGGAPQINGVKLIGNAAAAWGGAIYAEGSSALVVSSAVQANLAASGGGIFAQGAAPVLVNSLVAGNLAGQEGGGIYSLNSSLRLVNTTVAANRAGTRGGGVVFEGGSATAANIIVAANGAPGEAEIGGAGAVIQSSLVQGGCPPAIDCTGGVQTGDPLLVAATAPGAGGDYHLQPTSPAIDGGDNNAGLAPALPQGATVASISADLAGGPRIVPVHAQPPRIDLGAYEAPNMPPVFLSEPVTRGTTTIEYTYQAVAVDPNSPAIRLPVEAVKLAEWLQLAPQQDGSALLHGTPGAIWYGYYPIILRSTDVLGAVTEQAFAIYVMQRVYSVYLPGIRR